ncbi:MAG: phosphatase PAP2 family protein [Fibrobacter sp.]|nr:phosphatase PAP2 family protein [Fibrobacter sp.]
MLERIQKIDERISRYWTAAFRHRSERTKKLLRIYVRLGDGYFWIIVALLLWAHRGWQVTVPIMLNAGFAFAIVVTLYELIKLNVKRPRPFSVLPSVKQELPLMDQFSFPSGHTMNNLAVATTVMLALPNYYWFLFLLPLSWGLLRVVFGLHWLSDVIFGIIFGLLCFFAAHFAWIPISGILAGWFPMLVF